MSKADILFHPIRIRILVEISNGRKTSQEVAKALTDVPQATLYRHINALAEGDVLQVVEERPVRGTVEKVYTVNKEATTLHHEELVKLPQDELINMITVLMSTLIGDYQRYFQSEDFQQSEPHHMSFSKGSAYLSKEELDVLMEDMAKLGKELAQHAPTPERKRYIFGAFHVRMPEEENES